MILYVVKAQGSECLHIFRNNSFVPLLLTGVVVTISRRVGRPLNELLAKVYVIFPFTCSLLP